MAEEFHPKDPDFEARCRASFELQNVMRTMGISLAEVAPGRVIFEMGYDEGLTQHNGFLHAGVVTTAMDSACGYAAFTLMPALSNVLTIEFKSNFLAPAKGEHFTVVGEVIKPGRTISVAEGKAIAVDGGSRKLIATMQCTLMCIPD